MINTLFPSYRSALVPQSLNTISHYNIWNDNDLQSVTSKTNQFYNSFLPPEIREQNDLTMSDSQSRFIRSKTTLTGNEV